MFKKNGICYLQDESDGLITFQIIDLVFQKINGKLCKFILLKGESNSDMDGWYPTYVTACDEEYIVVKNGGERCYLYADYIS